MKQRRLSVLVFAASLSLLVFGNAHSAMGAGASLGRVRVSFEDSLGAPVALGKASWQVEDAESAVEFQVSALGVVEFPLVPLKSGVVTLRNALTPNGNYVFERWSVDFTSGNLNLVLQEDPSPVLRVVSVQMPDGKPVFGAKLTSDFLVFGHWVGWGGSYAVQTLADGSLDIQAEGMPADAAVYVDPKSPRFQPSYTDESGVGVLRGFPYPGREPVGVASYTDALIRQKANVDLSLETTSVTFNYMPWLEVASNVLSARANSVVDISVSAYQPVMPNMTTSYNAADRFRKSLQRKMVKSGVAQKGVSIRIIPPKGSSQNRCKNSILESKTDARGKARLRPCATHSGIYQIKASGAMPTQNVFIKVSGAPPMKVTSVSARQQQSDRIKLAWGLPDFIGGTKITAYVITATDGKMKQVWTFKSNQVIQSRSVTLSKFGKNKRWLFSISAVSKFGAGPAGTVSLITS